MLYLLQPLRPARWGSFCGFVNLDDCAAPLTKLGHDAVNQKERRRKKRTKTRLQKTQAFFEWKILYHKKGPRFMRGPFLWCGNGFRIYTAVCDCVRIWRFLLPCGRSRGSGAGRFFHISLQDTTGAYPLPARRRRCNAATV